MSNFNHDALVSKRPWLLVKPVGTTLWIGPLFLPGRTACWECLAQRLRANREVETYLQQRRRTTTPFSISRAAHPTTIQTALHLTALEIAKGIVSPDDNGLKDTLVTLVTLDVVFLETQKHTLVRRLHCHSCGQSVQSNSPTPLTLESRKKQFTADGGHRTMSPNQTIEKYKHHISPITGAVTYLVRLPAANDEIMHVYSAGHNLALRHANLFFLRRSLRSNSGGKGMTDAQAKASGLCEALERYSGNFQGNEIRTRTTYRKLGMKAIHPNNCMLFSNDQYQKRQERNIELSQFQFIPIPLDEDAEVEWTPVWSLRDREFKYVPTGYCYYGYPISPNAFYYWADSNGNAAGNTIEEAILQGFMELVERDSVCLWWYNRVQRPAVDLDSFDEPYIQNFRKLYRQLGRDIW